MQATERNERESASLLVTTLLVIAALNASFASAQSATSQTLTSAPATTPSVPVTQPSTQAALPAWGEFGDKPDPSPQKPQELQVNPATYPNWRPLRRVEFANYKGFPQNIDPKRLNWIVVEVVTEDPLSTVDVPAQQATYNDKLQLVTDTGTFDQHQNKIFNVLGEVQASGDGATQFELSYWRNDFLPPAPLSSQDQNDPAMVQQYNDQVARASKWDTLAQLAAKGTVDVLIVENAYIHAVDAQTTRPKVKIISIWLHFKWGPPPSTEPAARQMTTSKATTHTQSKLLEKATTTISVPPTN